MPDFRRKATYFLLFAKIAYSTCNGLVGGII